MIFTLLDWAYMPMSAVLGTVFMEITFGVYMLSAALPMYIVRKPGFAVFGALVAAGVNLLMGSPYGLSLFGRFSGRARSRDWICDSWKI